MSRRRSSSFAARLISVEAAVPQEPSPSSLQTEALEAAHELWELVFQSIQDARTGQTILQSSGNVCLVKAFLDRAHQLDHFSKLHASAASSKSAAENNDLLGISNWLSTMLLQGDTESGYTPLHWAVLKAKLPILLLVFRYILALDESKEGSNAEFRSAVSKRFSHRPLALLQGDIPNLSDAAKRILNARDNEGLTPFQLLERLQVGELEKCRKSLVYYPLSDPATAADAVPTPGRTRQNSFDIMLQQQENQEQNELADLHEYMSQEREHQQLEQLGHSQCNPNGVSYACEVLSFGRANHLALGVQGGTAISPNASSTGSATSSRPQRVQEFAQDRVGREGSAVAVAAAAHHTLVVTRNGKLYAFGVGTGGRLGTGENERHCPAPTRVLGALGKRRVVAVAAAENHSLCVTSEGAVYAFGSNRFGQLGFGNTGDSAQSGSTSKCCLPRRVDDLWKKNILCVNIAAGEKHSVALTQRGEVYVWGCNASGQLGVSHRRSSSSGMPHKVQRVEALWASDRRKICIQIAASAQATLVLAKPNAGTLPVNQVYFWGHGNHVPSKVHFSEQDRQQQRQFGGSFDDVRFSSAASLKAINPVGIACARFHNAAITADGRVYTWGLHAEPLGASSQKSTKAGGLSACSCPQLVTGMLSEEGGGRAIAIAASENHTAVVTSQGSLFTWGASYGKDVLGHEGVRWQPRPKRVPGVSRAVGLAAAKEHTILLVGASFPLLPRGDRSTIHSLELIAAKETAKYVDLFNALPLLMTAERLNCRFLEDYCREFIRLNFDGVLNLAQRSVMDMYLTEELANGILLLDEDARDRRLRPLVLDIVLSGNEDDNRSIVVSKGSETRLSDPLRWIRACQSMLQDDRILNSIQKIRNLEQNKSAVKARTLTRPRSLSSCGSAQETHGRNHRPRASSFSAETRGERSQSSDNRCLMLTTNMDLSTEALARAKHASLSKEIRGLKKKLNQIVKLENLDPANESLSTEQAEKVARRPQLESELSIFEPALEHVEKCLLDYSQKDQDKLKNLMTHQPSEAIDEAAEDVESAQLDVTWRCLDCKITCPDEKSYALHINGRKHKNKMLQITEEETKKAASLMIEEQHRQQMDVINTPARSTSVAPSTPSAWTKDKPKLGVQPRYKLPFPSHATEELVDTPQKQETPSKSLREIMEEEQRMSQQERNATKSAVIGKSSLKLPPGSAPTLKSPPWAAKPQKSLSSLPLAKFERPLSSSKSSAWQVASPRGATNLSPPSLGPRMNSSLGASKKTSAPLVAAAYVPNTAALVSTPSPRSTSSFGDFLKTAEAPPPPSQRARSSSAPWANAAPISKPRPLKEPPQTAKVTTVAPPLVSFQDIQQQEEEFKVVQDQSYSDNGKWFIERRERAGSFATIQERETKEKEKQLFIEEQKRIEEQIRRDIAAQKKKEEKKRRQKANKRAQKQKANDKKQEDSNGNNVGNEPQTEKHNSSVIEGAADASGNEPKTKDVKKARSRTNIKGKGNQRGPRPGNNKAGVSIEADNAAGLA